MVMHWPAVHQRVDEVDNNEFRLPSEDRADARHLRPVLSYPGYVEYWAAQQNRNPASVLRVWQ